MKLEWVHVNDRLPEYTTRAGGNEFVSVIGCVNGIVSECMYCNGVWSVMGSVELTTNKVTHWMPLPEPPLKS